MRSKKWLALLAIAMLLLGMAAVHASGEAHTHVWGNWIRIKDPSCTEDGAEYRLCSAANCPQPNNREDKTIARLGHTWGEWKASTPATCFATGVDKRTCSVCQEQESRTSAQLVHNWGAWITTKAPTCTATGTETRTCSLCSTQEQRSLNMVAHTWGAWKEQLAPTCTTTGTDIRTCSVCQTQEQRTVKALGHNWDAGVVTKAATCTEAGSKTVTCQRDSSHVETQVIPAKGHDWGAWVKVKEPDCTQQGAEKRTCKTDPKHTEERTVAALGHKPSGVWVELREPSLKEKGLRVQYCTVCGEVAKSQNFAPAGYTYGLRTWAYGPLGGQVNPVLSGTTARVVYIDMTQEGSFHYSLVTEDGWNIGTIEVLVAGGTVRVSMEKVSEPSVFRFRYWHQFEDAASVNRAKLMAEYSESLPFDIPVQVDGDSCLIVVRTDANYYRGRPNQQFSDMVMNLNGTGSYADEVLAALEALGIAQQ